MDGSAGDVTQLLRQAAKGDKAAEGELFQRVYSQLHRMAEYYRSRERMEHTLSPTALVHEAYMRFGSDSAFDLQGRSHFFVVASKGMRRVLVDYARAHRAEKRFGRAERVVLEGDNFAIGERAAEIIAVDEVLTDLERLDPRQSRIVELRFFGGFSESEIADTLNLGLRTVQRDWQMAKKWLYRELQNRSGHRVSDPPQP